MALENPALALTIKVQDILYILEGILKQRNWKDFELASIKLVYTPFHIFNYDILVEDKDSQTSQGTSGVMAINAVNGRLDPELVDIIEKQPVTYEKEISHDIQYEVAPTAISKDELKETGRVKLAAQLGVKKENVSVSGIRTVYWPVWTVFAELTGMVQKIEVDGVTGVPLNIEEVPTREKGWLEVTADTLQKMKSPSGWVELGGSVATAAGGRLASGAEKVGEQTKSGSPAHHTLKWFVTTKMGLYSLVLLLILILVVYLFYINPT
jgi:hypothetical protein